MLPDVEFYINVGDWPLETRTVGVLPILSWCGSTDTRDIVLPTYDVTHSTLETMRGVTNDLLSVQGNTGLTLLSLALSGWLGLQSNVSEGLGKAKIV